MLTSHQKQQITYFTKEFSRLGRYTLAPWQAGYVDKILSAITTPPEKTTVIDIASGSGYVAVELAKKGFSVIATDLTPQSIKLLNHYKKSLRLKKLKVIQCPAEKIPLPARSCHVIVANAILEHIPYESQTIKEWVRLLKPGGLLVITVPIKFRYLWPFVWYHNYRHDKAIGHLRRYDVTDLAKKIPLTFLRVYYSGNMFKIFGLVINRFLQSKKLESLIEKLDGTTSQFAYGANNLMVIFKK